MIPLFFPVIALVAAASSQSETLRYDDQGRPVIGVRIDDAGPYDMVVDTAAQTSFVTSALIAELGLAPKGDSVTISGATGGAQVVSYPVRRFVSGLFDQRGIAPLALPNAGSTRARGIVGMDLFRNGKLLFDRRNARIESRASGAALAGFAAISGRTTQDNLLLVPVVLNGVKILAMIDSGAARTVANTAVLRALGWADNDPRLRRGGEIRGATAQRMPVRLGTIDAIALGPATFRRIELLFSDDAVTGGMGIDGRPALLLGSDLLNALEAYAIDFPRGELQIRIPVGNGSGRRN